MLWFSGSFVEVWRVSNTKFLNNEGSKVLEINPRPIGKYGQLKENNKI